MVPYNIEELVLVALQNLVRRQKGGCVTFTPKMLAKELGLPLKPQIWVAITEILHRLGIPVYKINSHEKRFILTCRDWIWQLAKQGDLIKLKEVVKFA